MAEGPEIDWREAMSSLKGRTLRLYWIVQKEYDGLGIDGIMERGKFKKRSDIDPHIATLRRLKLISKSEDGRYFVPPGIKERLNFAIRSFVYFKGRLIPRALIGAIAFTAFFTAYLILLVPRGPAWTPSLALGLALCAVNWIWAISNWLRRPFK
ncbi:MAG: hypothetical protein QXN33_04680 [Candidatus Bathyarchaeia archaeon]